MAQRGAASLLLTASGVLCIRDRSRRPSSRSDHGPRNGGPSFPADAPGTRARVHSREGTRRVLRLGRVPEPPQTVLRSFAGLV